MPLRFFSLLTLIGLWVSTVAVHAQTPAVPSVYSNIEQEAATGRLFINVQGTPYYMVERPPNYTLAQMVNAPAGSATGVAFNFQDTALNGTLYYGLIPYGDSQHPLPVYFKRPVRIVKGQAEIDIKNELKGRYDMVNWARNGYGVLGYRVVTDKGALLYDGRVHFQGTGPFTVAPTVVEGPFINRLKPTSATIAFTLNRAATVELSVSGVDLFKQPERRVHEVAINNLTPGTSYEYELTIEGFTQRYTFNTPPVTGTREPFTFAYASDSRNGQGGGERNLYGANFYIMKKIMALAGQQDAAFFQFSGDLINGYLIDPREISLQYANWKRAVEPWWHYMPIYAAMGNHEALMRVFAPDSGRGSISVDRFPFETESAEAIFNQHFVNPLNGPESEDGASYDPDPNAVDFPSYKENVFYYTHDNVAVVVLNSDYFYAPSTRSIPISSGGLHAYIMDQQLAWLGGVLDTLEQNAGIDHVFVTQHTPFFPNGGHVGDDMWYRGNNDFRTYVAGKPLEKGIIERRDQLLDLLVNKSTKVRAILTGDEHNYARTEVGPDTPIYPANWDKPRLELSRTIYQINNGAAGAPYYAQEQTPWTRFVNGFTTQNALVLFDVNGPSLSMRVINPDTLEEFDFMDFE